MVWYNLKIGNWNIKYTGIKQPILEFEDCDENGNAIQKEKGSYLKGKVLDLNGNELKKTYKKINGKVVDKFSKTKEVKAYKEVDKSEIDGFMAEAYYFVDCEQLKQELMDSNKALVFGFTNGNGFKFYKSYLSVFGNALLMRLGLGHLQEQIKELEANVESKKLLEELKLPKVESAKVEELIVF